MHVAGASHTLPHISYDSSIGQSTVGLLRSLRCFRCWCFSIHIDCRVCELVHGHCSRLVDGFYAAIIFVTTPFWQWTSTMLHLRTLKRQCARYLLVQLLRSNSWCSVLWLFVEFCRPWQTSSIGMRLVYVVLLLRSLNWKLQTWIWDSLN